MTIFRIDATVEDAYAELDWIAERLAKEHMPDGYFELYVVDENRLPVERLGLQ